LLGLVSRFLILLGELSEVVDGENCMWGKRIIVGLFLKTAAGPSTNVNGVIAAFAEKFATVVLKMAQ